MPTALDTRLAAIVVSTINRYGKSVTFTVTSGGTPNVTAGTIDGATSTDYTVKATPPYPVTEAYTLRDVTTEATSACLIAASGLAFAPAVGQTVTIDTVAWRVVSASAIYSGELVCAWELGLAR